MDEVAGWRQQLYQLRTTSFCGCSLPMSQAGPLGFVEVHYAMISGGRTCLLRELSVVECTWNARHHLPQTLTLLISGGVENHHPSHLGSLVFISQLLWGLFSNCVLRLGL